MKNKNLIPFKETAIIALGEAVVSALVIALFALFELLGFTLLGTFDYTVPLGALLGSLVVVLNFLFLSISTNNTIDKIMAERPEGEMDDEQAAKFAQEYAMKLQASVKLSFIIRTLSMLAALIVAFTVGVFNVIATVIPLFMLRPIIYVTEIFRRKLAPAQNIYTQSYTDLSSDEEDRAQIREEDECSRENKCNGEEKFGRDGDGRGEDVPALSDKTDVPEE